MKFPWFVLAISLCMETLWGADIPALTKQAGTGNATAQYELAEIFAEGKGVARNPKLAVQSRATQHVPFCMFIFSVFYMCYIF